MSSTRGSELDQHRAGTRSAAAAIAGDLVLEVGELAAAAIAGDLVLEVGELGRGGRGGDRRRPSERELRATGGGAAPG